LGVLIGALFRELVSKVWYFLDFGLYMFWVLEIIIFSIAWSGLSLFFLVVVWSVL